MSASSDYKLAQAARIFVRARRAKYAAKKQRASFKCSEEVGPCWANPELAICPSCKKRAVAHAEVKRLEPIARKALRNLMTLVP
jgi:hypothetical protein